LSGRKSTANILAEVKPISEKTFDQSIVAITGDSNPAGFMWFHIPARLAVQRKIEPARGSQP